MVGLPDSASVVGFFYLAQLNFSHHTQHVVLALEIVEEGALADIRSFGDVFYGDIGETALAKEPKRATKQPQTRFGGAALAASHALQVGEVLGGERFDPSRGFRCMTFIHTRLYDHIRLTVNIVSSERRICQGGQPDDQRRSRGGRDCAAPRHPPSARSGAAVLRSSDLVVQASS